MIEQQSFGIVTDDGTPLASIRRAETTEISAKLAIVVVFAATGGLLFGYDLCIIASALQSITDGFSLSTSAEEAVVSVVFGGAAAGAFFGGPLADIMGRRIMVLLSGVLFLGGSVVSAAAGIFGVLLLGRFVVGVGVGLSGMVVSVYVAELAPSRYRGALVSLNEVFICLGCLVAFGAGFALEDRWRWMLGLGAVPAGLFVVGAWFLPESARWLEAKGRTREAEEVRASLGLEASSDGSHVHLKSLGDFWSQLYDGWRDVSSRGMILRAILVAIAQNMCFSNAVLYFSGSILQRAGVKHGGLEGIGVGIAKLVGVLLSLVLVDRLGRKPLLLGGAIIQAVSFAVLAIAFSGVVHAPSRPSVVQGALWVFLIAWDVSWAPLLWVCTSELAPPTARAATVGLAVTMFWLSSILTNQFLLSILDGIGEIAGFSCLAISAIIAAALVFFFIPETKGQTLTQIQQ